MHLRASWLPLALAAALLDGLQPPSPRTLDALRSPAAALLETDARAMEALEDEGVTLASFLGARGSGNDALARTAAWSALAATIDADLAALDARPGIADTPARIRFQSSWLRDPQAHFELIGVVNRLDRAFVDPSTCGEVRVIFRLVLQRPARPPTSLPMTVSVVVPQPKAASSDAAAGACAVAARAWLDLPSGGRERVAALAALLRRLPRFAKVEVNLQNFHAHATGGNFEDGTGYDDHAEYLLRSFDRVGDTLVARPLLNTPRADLSDDDKRALAAWIRDHFDDVDRGDWVLPDRFLAKRAISVAPRGFARGPNRVFSALYGDGKSSFADLPYDRARLVKSVSGLLRRLDQGTCQGCHETRSVAGFHLLGESRSAEATLDATAIAHSPHVEIDLPYRAAVVEAAARGSQPAIPRPFGERRQAGPGRAGARCAVNADATFAGWTCASGLACHRIDPDELGTCLLATTDGLGIGEACQDVALGEEAALTGAFVEPQKMAPCAGGGVCEHNLLGFPGGMCVAACPPDGAPVGGDVVCGALPAAGYENECFMKPVPIEACIQRFLNKRVLATCGDHRPCRQDYACGRMAGLPEGTGVCVPTYFVYGLRVDGPLLDR
jgi:hypothetical protein